MRRSLFVIFTLGILGSTALHVRAASEEEIEGKVHDLMAQMTTEEKLLQLLSYKPNGVPRLGIPNLEAGEALHGVVTSGATSFPQAIALASTWDPELIERVGTVIAQEARAVGIGQAFAPMLAVARDPRWGRIEESYGEDPYLVSEIGVAYVNGLQGKGLDRFGPDRIIATAKHFVADGEPWAGANGEDFEVSDRVLREIYFPPFEAVVKRARVGSIMPAHHALNGVPCHMNTWLLGNVLRQEWGFQGFMTSDMGDIPKLAGGHKMVADVQGAAIAALSAGVDMELVGKLYMGDIMHALRDQKISLEVVDQAVHRVLRSKIALLGLGNPTTDATPTVGEATKQEILNYQGDDDIWAKLIEQGKFTTPESSKRPDWKKILSDPTHDSLALEAAQKAIILLKNQNNLLPLDKTKLKNVLVVGPLAKQRNLGGYSTGSPKFYLNIVDELKSALGPSILVNFAPGCELKTSNETLLPAALEQAQAADLIIAVVGHSRDQLGENLDRDDLGLVGGQEKLVEKMQGTGKPVIVILQNGAPLSLPWIYDAVPAVLECWYLGQATGQAVVQVLLGEVNPGGKMPISVARGIGQLPCYYNHPVLHGPINYYGSKSGNLFNFGDGLSYTTFKFDGLQITPPSISPDQVASVTFTVTNMGNRAGDEVPQLYVRQSLTSLKRPVLELKRFQRISLQPGESKLVTFSVGFEQLKFWKEGGWGVEPGEIQLLIGASSDDIRVKGKLNLNPTKQ